MNQATNFYQKSEDAHVLFLLDQININGKMVAKTNFGGRMSERISFKLTAVLDEKRLVVNARFPETIARKIGTN